jgi:hypothetical protein
VSVHPVVEPNGRIQLYAGDDHVTVIDLRTNTIEGQIDIGEARNRQARPWHPVAPGYP